MEQIGFQGYASGGGFNPVRRTDYAESQARNASRVSQSLTDAITQLRQNANTQVSNAEQYGASLRALGAFSETLSKSLVADLEKRNQQQEEEGLAFAYSEGIPEEQQARYEADKAALDAADSAIDSTALDLTKNGVDAEVITQTKQLTGFKARGYLKGKARIAGEEYSSWLSDKLMTDSTTQIKLPDGTSITPSQAKDNPTYLAATYDYLRSQYFRDRGLVGMNPAFLNEHTFPGMRKTEAQLMAMVRRDYTISQSSELRDQYNEELLSGGSLAQWFTRVSSTLDSEGRPLGNSGSWNLLEKLVQQTSDAGIPLNLDALGDEVDPKSNQSYRQRWGMRWALLEEIKNKETRANWNDYQADQQMLFEQAEEQALKDLTDPNNPPSNADVQAVQRALFEKFQRRSDRLNELLKADTIEAVEAEKIRSYLKTKAQYGLLTQEDIRYLPLDLQREFSRDVEAQEKARNQVAGGIDKYLSAIEGHILNQPSVVADPQRASNGRVQHAVIELQNVFRSKFAKLINAGADGDIAAGQALQETIEYFDKSQSASNQRFFVGDAEKFFPGLLPTGVKSFQHRMKNIEHVIGYTQNGVSVPGSMSFDRSLDSPGLYLTKQEAAALGNTGFFVVPPHIQAVARKYGVDPFTIINRQRKALGFSEFNKPPSLQAAEEEMTPRARAIINRFPSPMRSLRAMGGPEGFKQFRAEVIPGGYGKTIQRAASKYNIPPEILAGILEVESGFRPNAYNNNSGATGIAQIVPRWHPEITPGRDANADIMYAAKYLSQLRKQLGGSLNEAIYAYNSGPGAIRMSQENREYFPKVMKAAAKYRYNPDVWSSGVLGRGKFKVIEHVTGDKTHPNYAADHDGHRYHEHFAFETVEMRKQAAALYRSLGYRVTSELRPYDKGSYHSLGLAIDVAPPLSLPYDDKVEAEWSRRARAVIGM